jgi:hypothetical protein
VSVRIKYPKRVKIGAKSYKIHWSAEDWLNRPDENRKDGDWALTSHPFLGIWIFPELHPQNKRETLLHEILHCLYANSGGDVRNIAMNQASEAGMDLEEYMVCRLEAPMMAWMVDNPGVAAFIMIGADEDRNQ